MQINTYIISTTKVVNIFFYMLKLNVGTDSIVNCWGELV